MFDTLAAICLHFSFCLQQEVKRLKLRFSLLYKRKLSVEFLVLQAIIKDNTKYSNSVLESNSKAD